MVGVSCYPNTLRFNDFRRWAFLLETLIPVSGFSRIVASAWIVGVQSSCFRERFSELWLVQK